MMALQHATRLCRLTAPKLNQARMFSWEATHLATTQKWFETVVIANKLCPFAPPMFTDPELMSIVSADPDTSRKEAISMVKEQALELVPPGEESPRHETTLMVLDLPFLTEFRDLVRFSWDLQEEVVVDQGLIGVLQLVLFHPKGSHQTYGDEMADNAADYTIRAPYPTVHLLREVDVLRAVQGGYPNLEAVPARNQEKFANQGVEVCRQRLQACYVASESSS